MKRFQRQAMIEILSEITNKKEKELELLANREIKELFQRSMKNGN